MDSKAEELGTLLMLNLCDTTTTAATEAAAFFVFPHHYVRFDVRINSKRFILQVSADFLRLNGSRQQFRNLLSARKKLGNLPPAYTRIDFSHDSLESGGAFLLSSEQNTNPSAAFNFKQQASTSRFAMIR
uniref:Uncharacterized protein n=1 Tax=Syphacia muris TaxID=451379 RepID=A0A0N5AT48_9BILA